MPTPDPIVPGWHIGPPVGTLKAQETTPDTFSPFSSDAIEREVERYLDKAPRVVMQSGKSVDARVLAAVREKLEDKGKIVVLAGAEERRALAQAKKEQLSARFDSKKACEMGAEVPPNALLKVNKVGTGGSAILNLQVLDLQTGCAQRSASAPWNDKRADRMARDAVAKLLGKLRRERADEPVAVEAADAAIPTNEAPALQPVAAPAEPVADEPEPHWVPSFRRGDRWRFRYQKIPADTDDASLTRDHIVERKVERVEQVGSGVAVHILEVGGPADQEERRFAEYYGTDGVGGFSDGVPEIRGEWTTGSPSRGDVAVTLPTGSTEKLGSSPREYWIHPKLGKVAEAVTHHKGDTYKLTLIAYDVGGEKAGNMDGEVQRCVWTNRFSEKAFEPFTDYSMRLRGLGHTYLDAKGSFTPFGSGWLSFEGGNGRTPYRITDRGILVNVKAWITPSGGEWVAAIWWSEAKTSLTLTHLTGRIARTLALQFDSSVEKQNRLWRDHSLLLLQRGEQCVEGIKAKGKGGKKWALALVPDDDDGTVQPRLIAGDWQ